MPRPMRRQRDGVHEPVVIFAQQLPHEAPYERHAVAGTRERLEADDPKVRDLVAARVAVRKGRRR